MNSAVLPMVTNLGWAPTPDVDKVEIFDRHNGVPTLGTFTVGNETHLFWRAAGYTGDHSIWLYVPMTPEEVRRLDNDDEGDFLDGIVFDAPASRFAAVAVADKNRIDWDREWAVPPGVSRDRFLEHLFRFVVEALRMTLEQDLPFSRRDVVQRASDAVNQLVPC